MRKPSFYICLWEYVEANEKCWKLVECYGADQDGYVCTPSKHASKNRCSYESWLNKKVWYDDKESYDKCPEHIDKDDYEFESIPGRLVTAWDFEHGVMLLDFNFPESYSALGEFAGKKIKEDREWYTFLKNGYSLIGGTVKAVKNMMGWT